VSAHYVWTPGGCIFVEGYWDHPLHMRGMLFAPIRPTVGVVAFTYQPAYVIQTDFLLTAMFVGPARRHYYFGDYFDASYERRGFVDWMNYQPIRRYPDPMFAYYRTTYRTQPAWTDSLTALYAARRSGEAPRPPRTLVQQNTVVNNITNNKTTNVNVVKNVNVTNIQNVTVMRPITQVNNTEVTALALLTPAAPKAATAPKRVVKMTQVNATQVNEQKQRIEQVRNISKQRQQVEAKLIADPPAKGTATARPAARLELPKPTAPKAAAKTGIADAPPPKVKPTPPAPPAVPKNVERQAPKEDRDPPVIRPPTGTKKEPPAGKKDVEPPAKKVPVPKKDKDDEPLPPKKAPVPKKDKDDEPPVKKAPMPKAKDEPPPKKAEPPKKDKDKDDEPPAKKGPVPKKDKDKD
jgi:hypothetical protein